MPGCPASRSVSPDQYTGEQTSLNTVPQIVSCFTIENWEEAVTKKFICIKLGTTIPMNQKSISLKYVGYNS